MGHELVGFGALNRAAAEVDAVFVAPEHLRAGIGRAVLTKLESMATSFGLNSLELLSSLNAVGFYSAHGYVPVRDEDFRHPSGLRIASLRMRKVL
jgi:GNAT superfamily N-acetyltransferase